MSVIVFADNKNDRIPASSLEAIYYGSKMDSTVIAVVFGDLSDEQKDLIGKHGASKILHIQEEVTDGSQMTRALEEAVKKEGANTVVFSYDLKGKDLAPRLAAKLKAGLIAGAVDLPSEKTAKKGVFSGKAFAYCKVKTEQIIIGLLPNSIKPELTENSAEVVSFSPEMGSARVSVVENKEREGDINLPEAELVVSAGRGLKGPENWGMVEELANELGAATACSRPVADIGWRPHHEHVGQTGIAIRPNLYIAIGISGAIQHLAGVNQSKTIVVVNTDPEAPFFKAADYGVVGDAFEVIPKLTEALKASKN